MALHLDSRTGKFYLLNLSGWFLSLQQVDWESNHGKTQEAKLRITRLSARYDKIFKNCRGIDAVKYRFPDYDISESVNVARNLLQKVSEGIKISQNEWNRVVEKTIKPLQNLFLAY